MISKKTLARFIRGWLPKEPKFMKFHAKTYTLKIIFMIIVLSLLAVPLFFLAIEARVLLGFGFVVLLTVANLTFGFIARKEGWYKPSPRVRRIRIVVSSGLFTAFAVTLALRELLGPLSPYFLIPFIVLFVFGMFIGDRIQKTFKIY